MEYGILTVECDDLHMILGSVASRDEAIEMARLYGSYASPHNPNPPVPPDCFAILRRNEYGYYTVREEL